MENSPSVTSLPPNFTLENFATIAYASALWNETNISPFFVKTLRTNVGLMDSSTLNYKYISGSKAYIKQMVEEKEKLFKRYCLPGKFSDRILCAFKSMGQRISLWCEYVTEMLKYPKEVAEKLHWTVFGTIDERKIFENLLASDKIQVYELIPTECLYYLACSNVSIDYIQLHWRKMLKFCKIYSRDISFSGHLNAGQNLHFIICSVIFIAKLESSQLFASQVYLSRTYHYSQQGNMFRLSIQKGCPIATRYYWSLLEEFEKKELILFAINFTARSCHDFFKIANPEYSDSEYQRDSSKRYEAKCFADLLIFFLTHLTEDEISEFDSNEEKNSILTILEVLISDWLEKGFLPLAFDLVLKYSEEAKGYKEVLRRILEVMTWNNDFGLRNKQHFRRKLFVYVWKKLRPYNWKETLDSEKPLIESIFSAMDFEILNFIINGECEEKYRKPFVAGGKNAFKKLVENNEYELLEKFMQEILQSEDERKWFRDVCLSFYHELIADCRFEAVDTLLDFTKSSNEKRKRVRNPDYVICVCGWLITKNRIQSADKALNWIFNTEADKQNYISKNLALNLDWIVCIWKSVTEKFTNDISRFLLWLLESEEEVTKFKIEKIASQEGLQRLFALLFKSIFSAYNGNQIGSEIFDIVDEILRFCLPPETVPLLKRQIGDNVNEWILFLSNSCCLHRVDDFLGWIFQEEKRKENCIKTFLRQNDVTFFRNTAASYWVKCNAKVICWWIETTHYFDELEGEEFGNEDHVTQCKKIIDILKNGDDKSSAATCKYIYSGQDNFCAT